MLLGKIIGLYSGSHESMSMAPELLEALELLLSDIKQFLGDHDVEFHNPGSITESENIIKKVKTI